MVRIFLVCCSVIFLFSCGASSSENKREKSSVPGFPVTIDISFSSELSEVKLSKIAEQIDYVPLETLDSALVGSYFQFQVCDSFLFIKVGGGLYSFKTSGEFVAHFPPVGRGPGEEYVRCFTIDERNKLLYFFGNYTHKLYSYTFDGKWTREMWDVSAYSLATLHSWQGLVFGTSFWDPKNDVFSRELIGRIPNKRSKNVDSLSVSFNKEVNYTPIYEYRCPYSLSSEIREKRLSAWVSNAGLVDYQNYGDSLLLYRDRYCDTVWQTRDLKEKVPRYIFKWKDSQPLTYEENMILCTSRGAEVHGLEKKYAGRIVLDLVLETQRYLFFHYALIRVSPSFGRIYDKNTHQMMEFCCGENCVFENDMDGGPDLTPFPFVRSQWIYKDKLYNLIWPYELLEHKSEVPRSAAVEKLYRTVKENDNPILMIVTLKK